MHTPKIRILQKIALLTLAGLVTAVALFYLEEDWRGKRAWDKCKAELEAKGLVLDWDKYIPAPVPDDQNFFTASTNILIRFKKAQTQAEMAAAEATRSNRWFWTGKPGCPVFITTKTNPLKVAMITVSPTGIPRVRPEPDSPVIELGKTDAAAQMQTVIQKKIGRSVLGSTGLKFSESKFSNLTPAQISLTADAMPALADLATLVPENLDTNLGHFRITATDDARVFEVLLIDTRVTAAADYLKWSDQFAPAVAEIREALKRPYAILPGDYSVPSTIPIPNFVMMRATAQALSQRAQCHLLLHEPEQALEELTLLHDLCRILQKPPTGKPETLVEAMINVAITGLYAETINDGLRWHEWQKPQLEALQAQLEATDLPPWVAEAIREELVHDAAFFNSLKKAGYGTLTNGKVPSLREKLTNPLYLYLKFAPRGWAYQNLVNAATFGLQPLEGLHAGQKTFSPHAIERAQRLEDRFVKHATAYNYLAAMALPNTAKAFQVTAYNQNLVNEAQIACALERYRLIDGEYPASLDALVPSFIEQLPHDIIGGQPLHYRRTDDGKFLLYSIGWNERDDGGAVALNPDGSEDRTRGDWVWKN